MRDPTRIKPFMIRLAHKWMKHLPDWRFGQLMSNFLGWVHQTTGKDIFFIEDDEMLALVDKFFEPRKEALDDTKSSSVEVPSK